MCEERNCGWCHNHSLLFAPDMNWAEIARMSRAFDHAEILREVRAPVAAYRRLGQDTYAPLEFRHLYAQVKLPEPTQVTFEAQDSWDLSSISTEELAMLDGLSVGVD